jgi:hypothetical protein
MLGYSAVEVWLTSWLKLHCTFCHAGIEQISKTTGQRVSKPTEEGCVSCGHKTITSNFVIELQIKPDLVLGVEIRQMKDGSLHLSETNNIQKIVRKYGRTGHQVDSKCTARRNFSHDEVGELLNENRVGSIQQLEQLCFEQYPWESMQQCLHHS